MWSGVDVDGIDGFFAEGCEGLIWRWCEIWGCVCCCLVEEALEMNVLVTRMNVGQVMFAHLNNFISLHTKHAVPPVRQLERPRR